MYRQKRFSCAGTKQRCCRSLYQSQGAWDPRMIGVGSCSRPQEHSCCACTDCVAPSGEDDDEVEETEARLNDPPLMRMRLLLDFESTRAADLSMLVPRTIPQGPCLGSRCCGVHVQDFALQHTDQISLVGIFWKVRGSHQKSLSALQSAWRKQRYRRYHLCQARLCC